MNEQIKLKIEEQRGKFEIGPNNRRGERFNNNRKVMAHIRMSLLEKLKLKQLPTEEQAIKLCGQELCEEINKSLEHLSKIDYLKPRL